MVSLPVFRGVQIGESGWIGHPYVSYREWWGCEQPEHISDFADSGLECRKDNGMAGSAVHGAERFQLSIAMLGHRAVATNGKKRFKQILSNRRHVAGKNQVSVAGGGSECGFNSGERSLAGEVVGYNGQAEFCIYCGIADEGDVAAKPGGLVGYTQGERPAIGLRAGFIGAHAAAASAHQYPCGSV